MLHMTFSDWQVYDPQGRRKYLSADETRRFLLAADTFAPDIRALCYTLAYTGARVSEVLALTRDHIDTDRSCVVFKTLKRRRLVFRTVPIPAMLIKMLLALPADVDEPYWRISRITAWRRIKDTMALARINGPMSCGRGLRHGFGMSAAGKSIPQNIIARWMGHSSLSTTAIYLDASGQEERGFASRMW